MVRYADMVIPLLRRVVPQLQGIDEQTTTGGSGGPKAPRRGFGGGAPNGALRGRARFWGLRTNKRWVERASLLARFDRSAGR
jgi:hypothetical protein